MLRRYQFWMVLILASSGLSACAPPSASLREEGVALEHLRAQGFTDVLVFGVGEYEAQFLCLESKRAVNFASAQGPGLICFTKDGRPVVQTPRVQ